MRICSGKSMTDDEWMNFSKVVNCNFMKCMAGMGIAGNGRCCNGGNWTDADCSEFMDYETWQKKCQKLGDIE